LVPNFTNIKERVLQIAEAKGVKKSIFFNQIGMSYGSFKGSAKERPLNSNAVENILSNFPDINPGWLIQGKGAMFIHDIEPTFETSIPEHHIPLLNIEAVAGFGSGDWSIGRHDIQEHYVVPDFVGIDFMVRVKGSSMYPKYASGDIVACRIISEATFIQWNKVYVISTTEQGILIKRLKQGSSDNLLLVVSDNQNYDPFEIPRSEITGLALVTGVIRLE